MEMKDAKMEDHEIEEAVKTIEKAEALKASDKWGEIKKRLMSKAKMIGDMGLTEDEDEGPKKKAKPKDLAGLKKYAEKVIK